jgi:hypothetical protein
MTKDDLKEKAIEAIPYLAVFGVAALAVYGVTKLAQAAKEIDIFPLDFGNDEYLTGLSEDSRED